MGEDYPVPKSYKAEVARILKDVANDNGLGKKNINPARKTSQRYREKYAREALKQRDLERERMEEKS